MNSPNHQPDPGESHMSFIASGMDRVRRETEDRLKQANAVWHEFFATCTTKDACYYIGDYLSQFDLAGEQVERRYDVRVSLSLEKGLRAATERQGADPVIEDVTVALSAYNEAVRQGNSVPRDELIDRRIELAAALLSLD